MPDNEIIAVDFAISPAAWAEIDHIRSLYDQDASDKADVPMIAWSIHQPSEGPQTEGVLIGFYRQSERNGIRHGIQTVAGREIVYFVNKETALKFSGKIIDFDARRGFYLT